MKNYFIKENEKKDMWFVCQVATEKEYLIIGVYYSKDAAVKARDNV